MPKRASLLKPALAGVEPRVATPKANESVKQRFPNARQDRQGLRMIGGYFPDALWERLRILAVKRRTTVQELLGEFIEDGLNKYPSD